MLPLKFITKFKFKIVLPLKHNYDKQIIQEENTKAH